MNIRRYSANMNSRDKFSKLSDAALTTQAVAAAHEDMRGRYRSHWHLDEAFLPAQSAGETISNKKRGFVAMPHSTPDIETPIAPWGVVIAYLALLASLGLLFVITATGGLDLG